MSEQTSTVPDQDQDSIPFTADELKQFDADDREAGSAIGKMLSLFFCYTVIAMCGVVFATYWWITHVTLK